MRILFVATHLPVPTTNGQAIRTLSIIRALVSEGHEVSFVSFSPKLQPEALHPLSSWCRTIDTVPERVANVSGHSDYCRRAICYFQSKSFSVERFRSARMRARIEDHLRRISFDLIIANGLYALLNVPQTGVPIILNCHNVEYIIIERFAAIEKSYAKKRYAVREAQWVRDAEEQACKRVTTAMVCSDYDRQLIRQLRPELPVFVVPNVVDTYSYTPAEAEHVQKGDCVILFQGSMDWYPNRDAVEFFALKIFPVIRGRYPSARFVVAGRNPSPRFVHKFNLCDGVEFTGTVPDMRPYLAAATVIVVPLRLGSGTRIKILEGCAAGKPVVSTRVGAEGLDLRPGIEILLADEPAEFAQEVIRLLENPQLQNAIGQSARAKAVACYSQSNVNGIIGKAISSASRESATSEAIQ